MIFFIDVILPIPVEKHFTYQINKNEAAFLKPGMRVAVPFGKSKIYTALVVQVHQNAPVHYEAKEIDQILDDEPVVTLQQLQLWSWIAQYYMCTEGDVFRAAMPSALMLESETVIQYIPNEKAQEELFTDDAFLVFQALQQQNILKIQDLQQITGRDKVLPIIKEMLQHNVVTLKEEVYEQYKPKLVPFVRLHSRYTSEEALHTLLDDLSRAPKQHAVVLTLFSLKATMYKPIALDDLAARSNVSKSIIKALVTKEILELYYVQQDRVTAKEQETHASKALNPHQELAFSQLTSSLKTHQVALLHGVTSSGKTELYVKLIEQYLENNQQVLYLLPEIALTTQLISRLENYFSGKVSVYHSKYSANERVEVWNNVLQAKPKAQLIVGARSSVFLPFKNLGLIVIDEEHEATYKQYDPAPRYHARDTATVLATFHNAKVVMGSATPSLESIVNVQQQKYALIELKRRFGDVLMPEIELVDIKTQYKKKRMKEHFSERLLEEMEEALSLGEQVILFQNRRGYAPVVECTTCGHAPQCPNCDVSLTYHKFKNQLRCHYCGYHTPLTETCLACGNATLDTKGFGTEQIEKEVKELFSNVSTARMDVDTTRGKHAYEKLITAFEQQEIQVLIGTQMLSKGLDFRNVTLVGVMNADNLLNFPDFRAHERSFQLLQQVAGRAGRTQKRGKVLIQTFNPHHQILQQVSVNDFDGMVQEQLQERYQYKYPPYYRLIRITFKHKDYQKVNEAAEWFANSLRLQLHKNVLGPEFPPVARIKNQYLKNVLVKIAPNTSVAKTKNLVRRVGVSFSAVAMFRGVRVIYNVDVY